MGGAVIDGVTALVILGVGVAAVTYLLRLVFKTDKKELGNERDIQAER